MAKQMNFFGTTVRIADVIFAVLSLSLVHFAGFFLTNFPNSIGFLLDYSFYIWFYFQFFIYIGVSLFYLG